MIFDSHIEKCMKEFNERTTKEAMGYILVLESLKMQFPKKFPKNNDYVGTSENDVISVAGLNVKHQEEYEREAIVNGEKKKYKIILRNISKEAFRKENEEKEKKEQEKKQKEQKRENAIREQEDKQSLIRMIIILGILIGLAILYLVIRRILFQT